MVRSPSSCRTGPDKKDESNFGANIIWIFIKPRNRKITLLGDQGYLAYKISIYTNNFIPLLNPQLPRTLKTSIIWSSIKSQITKTKFIGDQSESLNGYHVYEIPIFANSLMPPWPYNLLESSQQTRFGFSLSPKITKQNFIGG